MQPTGHVDGPGGRVTVPELVHEVERREAEGRDRMTLCVPRKSEPKGFRVRVMPGVMGELLNFVNGQVVASVKVADLRRYLERCGVFADKRAS